MLDAEYTTYLRELVAAVEDKLAGRLTRDEYGERVADLREARAAGERTPGEGR
jgi:hypothetical protein